MSNTPSNSSPTPFLKEINPTSGQSYIQAAALRAIELTPCISMILRGCVPIDMLEHVQSQHPGYLGRKAGTYADNQGKIVNTHQTLNDYRTEQINKRMGETMTEEEAVASLFPQSTAKARAKNRENIDQALMGLLSKLMYVWPSQEIRLLMASNDRLTEAAEQNDLIKWFVVFQQFCLSGAGNTEVNREKAERRMTNLKMKNGDFLDYTKHFREAADDLKSCESTFSEERIVTLFFQNLDQDPNAFFRWFRRFLDKKDDLYSFRTKPLSESIAIAQEYYDEVIRAASSNSSSHQALRPILSNASNSNYSRVVSHSNSHSKPDGNKFGHVLVSAASAKRKPEPSANTRFNKPRVEFSAINSRNSPVLKSPSGRITNRICKMFQTNSCKYGDNCKFIHSISK
jgi:hypothetical protein